MKRTTNQPTGGNERALRLKAAARRWRALHVGTGLVVGVWFVLMAVTGVLVNHQIDWGLDQVEISNHYLPDHYTDEFHPASTRLNVVLTDLHSGRFFGSWGKYISDVIALLVVISVVSGVYSFFLMRRANRLGAQANGLLVATARQQTSLATSPPPPKATDNDEEEKASAQPAFRVQ